MYSWLLYYISVEIHNHLPARFHLLLIAFPSHRRRSAIALCSFSRHYKIVNKVRMRQQEIYFKRHVTCQFFVSVVKFTDNFKDSWMVEVCQHTLRHYFKGMLHFSCRIFYSCIKNGVWHKACNLTINMQAYRLLYFCLIYLQRWKTLTL